MTGRLVTGGRAAARRARPRISFEDMAARRAERLVNLVICLLSTRQFLTAERIRDAVPGYEPADGDPRTDEAFKRMFERDKAELRDLGVPLETGRNSVFDAEDGYRITRRKYELPAIEFDPAEAAAVGLAARLWQSATLGTPARNALIKLRAGGTDVESASGDAAPATRRCQRAEPAGLPRRRPPRTRGPLRLRQVRLGRTRTAARRAVGRAVLAAALVCRRVRPRPRRCAQLPAVPRARRGRARTARGGSSVRRT